MTSVTDGWVTLKANEVDLDDLLVPLSAFW